MTKKMKKRLWQIIFGAVILAGGMYARNNLNISGNIELIIFLAAYIVTGHDILKKVGKNLSAGIIFDENFLMGVATVGAFLVGDYPEAVAVMLFYQVGELFQSYAVNKSRRSIAELMDIRPDHANVKRNGETIEVDPSEVKVGEIVIVKPGERVPLDGRVINGSSTLDTKQLTGESIPRDIAQGEHIISGCVNISGLLEIKVEKGFGESTVSKILDLVENASSRKASTENFITKFARYYTPIVVLCAVLLAVVPTIFMGFATFSTWAYRALTFLVISCPCALVISVPLSFFGGIGGASTKGILVKGSNYLEALSDVDTIVFDKTGTLTKGNFVVTETYPKNCTAEELIKTAAYAEMFSNHPISISLKAAYGRELSEGRVKNVEEIPGHGLRAEVDGRTVYAGNGKLMKRQNIDFEEPHKAGTIVHVAVNDNYAGCILISDELKPHVKEAMEDLRRAGVKKLIMLTGDNRKTGEAVAAELGLDQAYTDLLPTDKVEKFEEIISGEQGKGKAAFVGDGINDAPVLARADVGIAMGGLGSDAAIEAADVVIMTDEPGRIAQAMKISRKTLNIARQNIVFALGVKVLVLVLAAFGYATMWEAVFADVGVAFLAVLNAIRALKVK